MNNLILECIERHAPLVKSKFTYPSAPQIKQLDIADLQKNGTTIAFQHIIVQLKKTAKFRNIRNNLKSKMKETKAAFFKKILSSKRFKEIWKVVHRFLKLNGNI